MARSAPASRSFDFANLASEGIAAVEVYKTAALPLPVGRYRLDDQHQDPASARQVRACVRQCRSRACMTARATRAIRSRRKSRASSARPLATTRFGILITGSYQKRKASVNTANRVGWRQPAIWATNNNWGAGAARRSGFPNITNRPDRDRCLSNAAECVLRPQRHRPRAHQRPGGAAVPPDGPLTATLDFTYSRNRVETRSSNVGIWFNHWDTSSEWTDGPVAGPVFYTETFRARRRCQADRARRRQGSRRTAGRSRTTGPRTSRSAAT
jgi:hypothetical protein